MTLSVFDLFSVGIGPSSSHTVGPMRAAKRFVDGLADSGLLHRIASVKAQLFGSLGATGHGHGSEAAVLMGLQGEDPASIDTETVQARVTVIRERQELLLLGRHPVPFDAAALVLHRRKSLAAHPNGMLFQAWDRGGALLCERTYYSVGGGFVVDENAVGADRVVHDTTRVEFPFSTALGLLEHCAATGLRISDIVLRNELSWRSTLEVRDGLLSLWAVMRDCVEAGLGHRGVLPGGLAVPRRAPDLHDSLMARKRDEVSDPLDVIGWVNLFALAVNEENAAGGRIVTAPTNGAAGIIPAVLHYYTRSVPGASDDAVMRFMLTAGAVGILFKENASISGAEVGCQGEVGSACAMAAAALCEVLGGTPAQVENAAEVGLEHNLGLTCDPVGGLVQIPCIERNAIASMKAINAARLALNGDGNHRVPLDKAIKTMRDTGRDMHVKYKETARGGLAVNVIEC